MMPRGRSLPRRKIKQREKYLFIYFPGKERKGKKRAGDEESGVG